MAALRDTPLAHVLRSIGLKKTIPFQEEELDFQPPTKKSFQEWRKGLNTPSSDSVSGSGSDESDTEKVLAKSNDAMPNLAVAALDDDGSRDHILVDWYDANALANPRNWSKIKKLWSAGIIWWVSFLGHESRH